MKAVWKLSWRTGAALGLGLVCALALGSCLRGTRAPSQAPTPAPAPRLAAGPLFAPRTAFRLALFHARPFQPPLAELAARYPALGLSAQPPPEALPQARLESLPAAEHPLPPGEFLELAARALSPQEQAALAAAEHVTVLEVHTAPPALESLRQAHALVLELARAHGGVLLDEQSVELFGPERFEARRLGLWHEGAPLMEAHFNTFTYEEDAEHAWLVTVGLSKFGLPELELQHVPDSEVERGSRLLNLVAQRLLEGAEVRADGRLPVTLDETRHAMLKERLEPHLGEGARRGLVLRLTLADTREDEGEPRRVRLHLPESPGASPDERYHEALAQLWGARDSLVHVQHDEELLATSRRAVQRLREELKPRFREGLKASERLFVKAPFPTREGGDEWMWVRVQDWEGSTLRGVLESDPRDVEGLRAGARVEVEEASLFDYLLLREDGASEGNETEPLLRQRLEGP